ncbi:TRP-like ion channel Pkd2 [Cichlidogyrus casuarinus]|uniref:TRP-like ion channel Pkd2 n=1 Tax=Cichlidogyrus casuarinus TaxID=1844966 RepID=A0ABD2QIT0_9PLAT
MSSPKVETSTVTMEKFKNVLKRVDRIESSISCIVDKLDAVITKLDSLEEARSSRKSNMTRILNSLPSDGSMDPSERQRKIQEIIAMGLSDMESQELRSRPATQQSERK